MNFCDNVFYLNPRAMTSIGAESVIFNTWWNDDIAHYFRLTITIIVFRTKAPQNVWTITLYYFWTLLLKQNKRMKCCVRLKIYLLHMCTICKIN
jgi:hypothetical protein